MTLIVALLVVLAWATFLEASRGRDYTQWYVYHSTWFLLLLALLGICVLSAAAVRFPWKPRQAGFLITHAGLLVLLTGAVITYFYGQEGSVIIREGETADRLRIGDFSQIAVTWRDPHGVFKGMREVVSFDAGPRDWPDGRTLDLGDFDGAQLKVLKFYRHAQTREGWVPDDSKMAGPALRLAICDSQGKTLREDWLAASSFGAEMELGKIRLALQQVTADTMLNDFLKPPAGDVDKQGVLAWHYQGKTGRLSVSANVGKKTPVGDAQVEIVKYLPNAKPDNAGRFTSQGEEPKNPMLELLVHVPGAKEPLRQIAFAQSPALNFDMLHGARCPVKFWYHHPAAAVGVGIEFLQTTQDKLYYRLLGKKGIERSGEVKLEERIPLSPQFQLAVVKRFTHARQEMSFAPAATGGEEQEAAALLQVVAGGVTAQTWLKRNDPDLSLQQFSTPKGMLGVQFGSDQAPLGFALRLRSFRRGLNPGGMGDASFASSVQLIDRERGIDEPREISMNEPLTHGRYTLYQSGFDQSDDGKYLTVLTAAYDPGLWAKYAGSLMICAGILVMFLRHAYARRRASAKTS